MSIRAGDRVLLLETDGDRRWLVVAHTGGAKGQRGLGGFNAEALVGLDWGTEVDAAGKAVRVLCPSLADLHATVRRKAQIIGPKDTALIAFYLGLRPGDRVLESGIGSGAATTALAAAVGTEGHVVVQELRQDFADWAMDNLAQAGLADRIQVHIGDLTQGLADGAAGPFDGVLLDQPEPWRAIGHLEPHMAPGGRLVAYCPQVGQMESVHRALGDGWIDVRATETIERVWEVKERGARPGFEGLGHTGFLVTARWIGL